MKIKQVVVVAFLLLGFVMAVGKDFLSTLVSGDEIQAAINAKFDALFNTDDDGNRIPYVCTVCDEVLMRPSEIRVITVDKMKKAKDLLSWTWMEDNERIAEVEERYQFTKKIGTGANPSWLKGMGLSPRGSIYQESKRSKPGFTCCQSCKDAVYRNSLPRNAIVNMNHVGMAPKCLTDLTEVELAFLSPVKSYGYCFVYSGGAMQCMKGTLVFMRVKERMVAKSVTALNCMGLNDQVIVLISGKMTPAQKARVKTKTELRVDKLIEAVEWLVKNNKAWKDIDLDVLRN